MTFDPTKPVRTRDGTPARIIATDAKGEYPIIALVGDDEEDPFTFTAEGRYWTGNEESGQDLVNAPETVERFYNVYLDGQMWPHDDRASADGAIGASSRIALVRMTFEDGIPVAVSVVD